MHINVEDRGISSYFKQPTIWLYHIYLSNTLMFSIRLGLLGLKIGFSVATSGTMLKLTLIGNIFL